MTPDLHQHPLTTNAFRALKSYTKSVNRLDFISRKASYRHTGLTFLRVGLKNHYTSMKTLSTLSLLLLFTMTSCEVIGDIFGAGVYLGVFMTVIVIVIIIVFVARIFKK